MLGRPGVEDPWGARLAEVEPAEPDRIAAAVRALRTGASHIQGHGGIEPATAARLSCDAAKVVGVIVGSDGDVLHHGRTKRLVTAHQRRALMVRDRGMCRFPGCHQRRFLDAHHVVHWAAGGATDLSNLVLLCGRHHTWAHEGGITITAEPASAGRWVFRLPDGRRLDTDQPVFTDAQLVDILTWHARNAGLIDRWHPDARRLVAPAGATTFSIHHTVDALFSMQLKEAA